MGNQVYLSDCGFAKVNVEANIRPEIRSINIGHIYPPYMVSGMRWAVGLTLVRADVFDKHTSTQNLNYTWKVSTYSANGTLEQTWTNRLPVLELSFLPVTAKGKKMTFQLTVSDGHLSAVSEKTIQL